MPIYLFIRQQHKPATHGSASTNAKKRKKGIGKQKVKLPTPAQAMDELIGEEKLKKDSDLDNLDS